MNKNGFTTVEILLTLILVVIIGFAGWNVLSSTQDRYEEDTKEVTTGQESATEQQDNVRQFDNEEQRATDSDTEAQTKLSDNWTNASSELGDYRFKIPNGWSLLSYIDSNFVSSGSYQDSLIFEDGRLGSIRSTEGGSDGRLPVVIDIRDREAFIPETDNFAVQDHRIGGLEGKKYTYSYPSDYECEGLGCPLPGETWQVYSTELDDSFFVVYYSFATDEADQSAIVEELVSTIVFN